MKLVEVFIPAYNSESFLEQTIESVISQDYPSLRITIVDNCSSDRTQQISAAYQKKGVNYICNSSNIGAFPNHLKCIRLATGDYLKLLSSDDILLPGVISSQVSALERYQAAGVATCNAIETDQDLNPRREIAYLTGYMHGHAAIKHAASTGENRIGGPSNWLLRVSTLKKISYDYNGLKWLADLDYVCSILQISDLVNVDHVGFYYRRHHKADSFISCSSLIRSREQILFAKKWQATLPMVLKARLRHLRNIIICNGFSELAAP